MDSEKTFVKKNKRKRGGDLRKETLRDGPVFSSQTKDPSSLLPGTSGKIEKRTYQKRCSRMSEEKKRMKGGLLQIASFKKANPGACLYEETKRSLQRVGQSLRE